MNATCPPTSFLASPWFYAFCMHSLSALELPIHLFCGFIIIFKTPSSMKSVKFPLLYYHFWCSLLDIIVSVLLTPYALLPEVAGFTLGIWSRFGVSPEEQIFLYAVTCFMVGVSLACIYENRFFVISTPPRFWSYLRYGFLFINHLIALTYFLPVYLNFPNQTDALKSLLERITCLPKVAYESEVLVLAFDEYTIALIDVPLGTFLIGQMVVYLALTIRTLVLETRSFKISKKTSELKRKFFISLLIQSSIPILVFLVPLLWNLLTMKANFHVQEFNNLAFFLIATHGLVSTIAILTVHEAYRKEALRILGVSRNVIVNVSNT